MTEELAIKVSNMNNDLEDWRKQIDRLDEKVLNILAKRAQIVKKIGQLKKRRDIPVLDQNRWDRVLTLMLDKGNRLGLSKDFVKKLFSLIHQYSVKIQKENT